MATTTYVANVSLLIDIQTGHVDLAPLYDTVPTALRRGYVR